MSQHVKSKSDYYLAYKAKKGQIPPRYLQDNEDNIFKNCDYKDKTLQKQYYFNRATYLGDEKMMQKTMISQNSILQQFSDIVYEQIDKKKKDEIKRIKQNAFNTTNGFNVTSNSKHILEPFLKRVGNNIEQKGDPFQPECEDVKLVKKQIQNIDQKIQENQENIIEDRDQKILLQAKEKYKEYKKYWNIKLLKQEKKQNFKQLVQDKDELMNCLGIDQQKSYSQSYNQFKNSLRSPNVSRISQDSSVQLKSKWRFDKSKMDQLENQKFIQKFYEAEFLKQNSTTEVNKKNKSFLTEYQRYLTDNEKFKISCGELTQSNLIEFQNDYSKKYDGQCESRGCINSLKQKIDTNILNFKTQQLDDLQINGQNQFQREKTSFLQNFYNLNKNEIKQNLKKIQKFQKKGQNHDQEEIINTQKKKTTYITDLQI